RLRVVERVLGGTEVDGVAVQGAEAGGRVGDALADNGRDNAGQDQDAEAAQLGRDVAPILDVAGADHHVRVVRLKRLDKLADLVRVVLAVAVHLHGNVVAPVAGKDKAGLHRSADAEVIGQR